MKRLVIVAAAVLFLVPPRPASAEPVDLAPDLVLCQGIPVPVNPTEFYPAFCPDPIIRPQAQMLLIFEPGSSVLSDQLYTFGEQFYFRSDPDLVALDMFQIVGSIFEDGSIQDASAFFGLPNGYVAFQSDIDPPVVPEPTTLALLGSGLCGIIRLAGRRRRR